MALEICYTNITPCTLCVGLKSSQVVTISSDCVQLLSFVRSMLAPFCYVRLL